MLGGPPSVVYQRNGIMEMCSLKHIPKAVDPHRKVSVEDPQLSQELVIRCVKIALVERLEPPEHVLWCGALATCKERDSNNATHLILRNLIAAKGCSEFRSTSTNGAALAIWLARACGLRCKSLVVLKRFVKASRLRANTVEPCMYPHGCGEVTHVGSLREGDEAL